MIRLFATGFRILSQHLRQAGLNPLRWLHVGYRGARLIVTGRWLHLLKKHTPALALYADYPQWVRQYDTLSESELSRMRLEMAGFAAAPSFTLYLPAASQPDLERVVASVRQQLYPHWHLVLQNDPARTDNLPQLTSLRKSDPRILASASTLDGAACRSDAPQWVLRLDGTGILPPHALYCFAKAILQTPDCEMIYADQDAIDANGLRHSPSFKPDWNPDLLTAQNYVGQPVAFEARLLEKIEAEAQGKHLSDWERVLRAAEILAPGKIHHLPRVLYHQTAALLRDATEERKALAGHWARLGKNVSLEETAHGWRCKHALPVPAPKVSIIIPSKNNRELLQSCISSIQALTDYPDYEIIAIDNQSDDAATLEYLQHLSTQPNITVLRYPFPFNFSAINNFGVRHAAGEVLVLLNDDTEIIEKDWLAELAGHALRPEIGAVGALLLYPDRTIQHAGVFFGENGIAQHLFPHHPETYPGPGGRACLTQNLSAVTGACLALRKSVYLEAGGMDETLAVAYNDIELCLRVKHCGYQNLWTPYAKLIHHESVSRGHDNSPQEMARLLAEHAHVKARWPEVMENDPAYNPNLSLTGYNYSLAYPPRA